MSCARPLEHQAWLLLHLTKQHGRERCHAWADAADCRRAWAVAADRRSAWAADAVAADRRIAWATATADAAADGFRLAWPVVPCGGVRSATATSAGDPRHRWAWHVPLLVGCGVCCRASVLKTCTSKQHQHKAPVARTLLEEYETRRKRRTLSCCALMITTICYCFCCLLYTSPSPRDLSTSRMPSSA